ncbi:hypothetical protein AKL17_1967 [Frigidibacter mobilis]|uniref:Uncharacterized protein n=1 Tax=Frigidibacter mobilis TaxID=1335048 RepID=A0A159Z2G2_9RHOB|nr:hypothetical protein AKL17_1967 [Frigidibacter mobilis]
MAGQDHGQPRLGRDLGLIPVQRHPHLGRGSARGHIAQHHLVERDADLVGIRSVDADDPALDGAVIAEGQHRVCHAMPAGTGQQEARQRQDQRGSGDLRDLGPAQPAQKRGQQRQQRGGIDRGAGLRIQREPEADSQRQADRHPDEEPAPRARQRQQRPGGPCAGPCAGPRGQPNPGARSASVCGRPGCRRSQDCCQDCCRCCDAAHPCFPALPCLDNRQRLAAAWFPKG